MLKFLPCDKCVNSKFLGHTIIVKNGQVCLSPCKCYKLWQKKEKLKIAHKKANIPIIVDYTLTDYIGNQSEKIIKKLVNYVNNFKSKSYCYQLYFFGDNSTQKTTVAFNIASKLIQQNLKVYYITMKKLIDLYGVFENQRTDSHTDLINIIENANLLIIDECFAHKINSSISDRNLNLFLSFLKNRLEIDKKGTIFISNNSVDNIEKFGYTKAIKKVIQRNIYLFEFKDNVNLIKNDFDPYDLFM